MSFKIEDGVLKKYIEDDGVTEAIIPSNVTIIDQGAFCNCTNITSIIIPDDVTDIGFGAFKGCSSITSITIPDSVIRVGDNAFSECLSLKTIRIPKSVESIDILSLDKMNDVIIEGNTKLEVKFAWPRFFAVIAAPHISLIDLKESEYKRALTLGYLRHSDLYTNEEIANEYKKYANGQFKKLIELVMKNDLPEIVETYITLGKITTKNAESEILKLAEVNNAQKCIDLLRKWISSNTSTSSGTKNTQKTLSATELKKMFGVEEKDDGTLKLYAYKSMNEVVEFPAMIGKKIVSEIGGKKYDSFNWGNSKVTKVIIPDTVTTIESRTFKDCDALVEVVFPDTEIEFLYGGDEMFEGCESLISASIPKGVEKIGKRMFYDCKSLESVLLPNTVTEFVGDSLGFGTFRNCESLKKIELPDSIKSIGDYIFRDCPSLMSLNIPDSVESIGVRIIDDSVGLYNEESNWEDGILYIDNCALSSQKSISGICRIKDGTRIIAGSIFDFNPFYDKPEIEEFIIPDSVTYIGKYAFEHCRSLKKVTLSERLKELDNNAFRGCTSLTSVNVPNSVIKIGYGAFAECSNLVEITLPDNDCELGSSVFEKCENLKKVKMPGNVTFAGWGNIFEGCPNLTIYAPAGSKAEEYAKTNNINFVAE